MVSCNCLTRLAAPFTDYFEKTRGFSELDSDKLAYQIMESHAKAIGQDATGVGVLITDTERFAMQGDRIVSRTDLLKALRLPPTPIIAHNEEWDWLAAPHPEAHPTHDYVHTVNGKIYQRGVVEAEKPEGEGLETDEPLPAELEPEASGDSLGDIIPER